MSNQAKFITFAAVVIIIVYAFFAFDIPYRNADEANIPKPGTATAPRVSIDSPASGSAIASPVSISGKAVGTWFFEASFPVKIIDASGKVLGQGHADAQGDWMTEGLVPWTATISFARGTSTSTTGFIRLEKDNPSGDPARDEHIDFPVTL